MCVGGQGEAGELASPGDLSPAAGLIEAGGGTLPDGGKMVQIDSSHSSSLRQEL